MLEFISALAHSLLVYPIGTVPPAATWLWVWG